MADLSPTLLILNGVFLALLPIAWLLYRSARKQARREAATARPVVYAPTPAATAATATASPAITVGSVASDETAVAPATQGTAPVANGVSRADASAVVNRVVLDTAVTAAPPSDAILLMVETVAADQPWIVTRFVHELTAEGFEVTLSANRETVLGKASSTIRVTQLNGEAPTSPHQTLVSTGRADAEAALSALLRAVLLLGYRIKWTVDTEVMLATPKGDVARVHLVPAPSIDFPDAGSPRPALLPHERHIG